MPISSTLACADEVDNENCEGIVVPKEGMIFESEDKAYNIYNLYAGKVGFSIRKSHSKLTRDGTVYQKHIVCNNEGERGCFLTHCGWNSTIEAIVIGVPLLAMPQWTDQPTTAKYIESASGNGVRLQRDNEGIVRKNADKWMKKAKEAMKEGGSSSNNIAMFAAKYTSH
ncbi:UDP-glycosyltransferase 79-like [Oryza brachyantha]|uniref:UDP-glycosyltransferase 79-like n=1 Tax=Oryza brachyantha TaxID=4533 RepID=UPI001ADCB1D2|nr:UDP-glycosyltransferase 79-like [Oryza brachyantha]